LGDTLLIFKNTNLVGVWISFAVSVIFSRDKFSRYVGGNTTFHIAKKAIISANTRCSTEFCLTTRYSGWLSNIKSRELGFDLMQLHDI
jgi:hypothetical protein